MNLCRFSTSIELNSTLIKHFEGKCKLRVNTVFLLGSKSASKFIEKFQSTYGLVSAVSKSCFFKQARTKCTVSEWPPGQALLPKFKSVLEKMFDCYPEDQPYRTTSSNKLETFQTLGFILAKTSSPTPNASFSHCEVAEN